MKTEEVIALLKALKTDPNFAQGITHIESIPAKKGIFEDIPSTLHPTLQKIVVNRGIKKLYSHQCEAYNNAINKKNICIVTPTASGKTLCYNLPVLQTILENENARALYLFPTKALSQDQQSELTETISAGSLNVKAFTFDGDTPVSLRTLARDTGRIIITNPDMLHSGILPNHTKWNHFFSNLSFIVIDEMHTYRGVFGSHVANVIRRLKRIASFYGSKPVFILCSATIGNPRELSSLLIEDDVFLIDKSGAEMSEKHIVFYNPPIIDPVQGLRKSSATESEKIALLALRMGIKTILFARSRIRTELIAAAINKALENTSTENSRIKVDPYRGGYLPSERRATEKGLRDGTIQGVVSTNALELGIDIGGLDCAVIAGFPSGFASFWQQAGRAGRRQGASCAIFVASSAPLDQYILQHPEYFFGKNPECGRLDPGNPYIAQDHAKCAAFEIPFSEQDKFGPDIQSVLSFLEEDGIVRKTSSKWYWSSHGYPAEGVSLRSASADNVVIIDITSGKNTVIGEMDRPGSKEFLFNDAVYIHRGKQFIVRELDIENRICRVEERDVNYYTDAVVKTDIQVLSEDNTFSYSKYNASFCDVLVRSQATKFKKLTFHSHENIGFGEIYLPEEEMHTRACFIIINEQSNAYKFLQDLESEMAAFVLSSVAYLIKETAPVFLLCENRDLGSMAQFNDPHFGHPSICIYDHYPGGTGLSEALTQICGNVLIASFETISECKCISGCPSCIGAFDVLQGKGTNRKNNKQCVKDFLSLIIS